MDYLIAVLTNRIQVEDAKAALTKGGVSTERISIVGNGFQSADEFGLINPNEAAAERSRRLAYWLIPFGFVAGYAFNWLTGIEILSSANAIINHIIGGILGAGSGALGALFVGGAIGWTIGSGDALAYRNRINAGKYLLIVKGSDEIIRNATRILRQFEPETIQGYTEPVSSTS
jgi:hypothetical protein